MKEIVKINLNPWGTAVLLHQTATGKAFSMSLTLLFSGKTSASELKRLLWSHEQTAWESKGMGEKRSSVPKGGALMWLKKGIKISDRGFSIMLGKISTKSLNGE